MALEILRAGPGVTVQDMGRPGWLSRGLSRGGAMDRLALVEGAVLLGQPSCLAALEVAGSVVSFRAGRALRLALTGARMRARADGAELAWNACHALDAGRVVEVAAQAGGYGYLSFGGGVATPRLLGSRSAHLAAGLGRMVAAGDVLPLGAEGSAAGPAGLCLDPPDRAPGGPIRLAPGPQTGLFAPGELARLTATPWRKDARGNRMGQRLTGARIAVREGLRLLSGPVLPGDIQITGDGTPYVLLAECQTTGGYPRIGTILPADLPRLVQAPPGAELAFTMLTPQEAVAAERAEAARQAALPETLRPLLRDPRAIPDLLAYQLISGVTRGDELENGE